MTSKLDRLQLVMTFLAVAEHGNLSTAARVLGTTQPTVSRRLRDLESMLGTRLATRTTHHFGLTPEGEELQRKATAWADVWTEWEHGLKATTVLPSGKLTLIGPHGYGHTFLMRAIRLFRQAHPQVEVELRLTDRPVDMISQGVDCWICAGGSRDETLHARRLGHMHRILIAAGDFPTENLRQPGDLAQVPVVGLIPHVSGKLALQSIRTGELREIHVKTPVATDGLLASYQAIKSGLGVGSAAKWLCGDDLAQGTVRQVLPEWELEPIAIEAVSIAGRFRPARINAFVDILVGVLGQLDGFEGA